MILRCVMMHFGKSYADEKYTAGKKAVAAERGAALRICRK
jgi:hypothetical protein